MKQSSELITDFLSFYEMLRDYLNSISTKRSYLGSEDIIFFSRLLKEQLDTGKVAVNVFKPSTKWQSADINQLLLRLERNGIITILYGGEIRMPDNIPFELTVC